MLEFLLSESLWSTDYTDAILVCKTISLNVIVQAEGKRLLMNNLYLVRSIKRSDTL